MIIVKFLDIKPVFLTRQLLFSEFHEMIADIVITPLCLILSKYRIVFKTMQSLINRPVIY